MSVAPRGWERLALAVLVAVALALRLVCVAQYEAHHPMAAHPVIDEASYDAWGARIAAGDWLGEEVFFQEPLYPYALGAVYALAGHDLTAARAAQAALGALCVLLVFLLARDAFGRAAGWVAGVGLALYAPAVLLPCLLLKPNLFLPLLAGFAWLLARRGGARRWLALGVLGGLGALLRGNVLILLPVFAAWAFLEARGRAGLARLAGFALGVALVLGPVLVRNQVVGGVFALTTSGAGTNVYGGNNAENPYGVATEFPWVRGIPRYEAEDWRQEAQRRAGRELDAGEVSSFWLRAAGRSALADPALHARILWNKLRLALGAYEVPDNHLWAWDRRFVPLLAAPWPGFALWGSLGLAGLLLWLASRGAAAGGARPGALALLFVAYLGTIVLTVVSARARLPLVVLLLPFAGAWASELGALLRRRDRSFLVTDGALLAVALAAGALAVNVPVFDAAARAKDLAERDYNLAVQCVEEGRYAEARALSGALLGTWPDSARLRVLRADLDWREGTLAREAGREAEGRARIEEALAALREVSARPELAPRASARAPGAWPVTCSAASATRPRRRFFRPRAREFAPRDPELWWAHVEARAASCDGDAACRAEVRAGARGAARRVP
ncbi:MAG: glycosyltransferase family 39 protein [Planctomycetes bacterium]|nr:glycosyltransferase family 39 protein [Planctomycetota bacterium]